MKSLRIFFVLPIAVGCILGCSLSVNKTITIADGESVRGSQNTVNGNILVGSHCEVNGDCRSVNGIIEVGSHSKVKDLQTVNGRITLEREVIVRGKIESVNGPVVCDPGVQIYDGVATVNGSIDLENTVVRRDITTYNGDIQLLDRSLIQGDIVVKRSKGDSHRRRQLRIDIAEESVVEGNIIVRDKTMDVKVILSEGGRVRGRIQDAEVIEE